jgi:acyl CoA:acetate/3-ketoacid CoA transferase alpha subunit
MRPLPLDQSVAMIPDGASLMIGGFMAVGTPERVIDEIVRQNKRDLTVIANEAPTTWYAGINIFRQQISFPSRTLGRHNYPCSNAGAA